MQNYSDHVLTIDDLDPDEIGSSFTNCSFEPNAEGDFITGVDFSYAIFTDCVWNVDVIDSRFRSAEGNLPPVTQVTFESPPAEEELFDDANGRLFKGDGVNTVFSVQRISEPELRAGIENNGYTVDDYSVVMGKADHDVVLETGPVSRSDYLAQIHLELSTDAVDSADPVNGIPDIPADGVSFCTITIRKLNRAGVLQDGPEDNDTVDLECTRGMLTALRVGLVNGESSVDLVSVAETCISKVTARAEGIPGAQIEIQFAPPAA